MRAVIFIIIISIHFILGLPYLGLIYLIGIFNYKQRIKMAYAYNRLTSWWLYTISGAKFVTQGLENLYQDTNVVYVGNHRSMIDIPLMMLFMKDPIILIGKDSIKKWPFISWWLHAMGGYFLDRSSGKAGFKTNLALYTLKAQEVVHKKCYLLSKEVLNSLLNLAFLLFLWQCLVLQMFLKIIKLI